MDRRQQERPLNHHPPPPNFPSPFAPPQTAQPPVQIPFSDPFQTSRDPFLPSAHARRDSYGGPGRWPSLQGTLGCTSTSHGKRVRVSTSLDDTQETCDNGAPITRRLSRHFSVSLQRIHELSGYDRAARRCDVIATQRPKRRYHFQPRTGKLLRDSDIVARISRIPSHASDTRARFETIPPPLSRKSRNRRARTVRPRRHTWTLAPLSDSSHARCIMARLTRLYSSRK